MRFYKITRFFVVGIATLLFRVKVRGVEKVPTNGAYVVAPTHRSWLDIPFAATITHRRLRFLAKQELFEHPFWKWAFSNLGAVPVDRAGSDRAALRAIETAVRDGGEPVAIFPEGTRFHGPALGELQSGAVYVALRTGVPIVPVGIGGSEETVVRRGIFRVFSRVCVVVGEPIVVPKADGAVKRSMRVAVDAELNERLQACFDEARDWSAERSA